MTRLKRMEEDRVTARDLLGKLFVNRRQEGQHMAKMMEGKKNADEFVLS
jgi:hypothetical protein